MGIAPYAIVLRVLKKKKNLSILTQPSNKNRVESKKKKKNHCFKNWYGQRTGKESGFWFFGLIRVEPMVEPVTS